MAVQLIPTSYKNSIAKWCYVKIKKMKNPLKPWKTKKVRTQKFDSGKNQETFFKLIDKINEIIDDMLTVDKFQELVEELDLVTLTQVNSLIDTHNEQTAQDGAHTSQQPSDRRLKSDIRFIGVSPSGINIYRFKFIDSKMYGKGLYQGVMSDEVPESVVVKDTNGYDVVDYDKIDVDFVQVNKV